MYLGLGLTWSVSLSLCLRVCHLSVSMYMCVLFVCVSSLCLYVCVSPNLSVLCVCPLRVLVLGRDPKALSWLFVSERHRRKGLYTLKILKAGQVGSQLVFRPINEEIDVSRGQWMYQ
jgi:hypothetical protein